MIAIVLLVLGQAVAPPALPVPEPLYVDSAVALQVDAGVVRTEELVCRGAASTGPLAVDGGLTVSGDATFDGGVWVGGAVEIGGLGARMKMLLLQPMALGAIPACTTDTRGARVAGLWPSGLSDGGFDAEGQECDGDHWITSRFLLGIAASPKAGSGAFWRLDPRYPGALTSIPGSVDTPGVGAGSLEVIVRQGSAVKCRGSLPSCASAAGTALRLDCGATPALFAASPDGGAAYALIAEVDAGCAQTPGLDFAADVRRFGYPDPGWSPSP